MTAKVINVVIVTVYKKKLCSLIDIKLKYIKYYLLRKNIKHKIKINTIQKHKNEQNAQENYNIYIYIYIYIYIKHKNNNECN